MKGAGCSVFEQQYQLLLVDSICHNIIIPCGKFGPLGGVLYEDPSQCHIVAAWQPLSRNGCTVFRGAKKR